MELSQQKQAQIWNRVLAAEQDAGAKAEEIPVPVPQVPQRPSDPTVQSAAVTPGSIMAAAEEELSSACTYRALATHYCGEAHKTLLAIAEQELCHARQLGAIYFLLTGSKACPAKPTPPCITCRTETIRAQYQHEQRDIAAYEALAALGGEFSGTFAEIAGQERCHAEKLICVIQQTV